MEQKSESLASDNNWKDYIKKKILLDFEDNLGPILKKMKPGLLDGSKSPVLDQEQVKRFHEIIESTGYTGTVNEDTAKRLSELLLKKNE